MKDIVDTDPVPAVEEPDITLDATTEPGRAEPKVFDGSGRRDGSAAPWLLTHRQQVHNLMENWKRAFTWTGVPIDFGNKFVTNPWFGRVVAKLREDPCLDSCELEIDEWLLGRLVSGFRMTSLDLAILMGDLKMVEKILERSSNPDNVIRGSLVDQEGALGHFSVAIRHTGSKAGFLYTPLHLAVAGGDSDIVDALLEKGADVYAPNWSSETPLELAWQLGNLPMFDKLQKLGKKFEGEKPLHEDVDFMKELLSLYNIDKEGEKDAHKDTLKTPLHYLAATKRFCTSRITNLVQYFIEDKALDMKALDSCGFSAFYVAVLCCNSDFVNALLNSFKDQIQLNEACDVHRGPPIQIAFEGGELFKDIERALMECDIVKGYMDKLYRDRQVYVDAANAILVGAALIASVTFASWLQPPLSYTSYFGEGYSSFVPSPSTSDLNYVDVEHNIALRAFWVFNALSFYFAIATVVCGARSVLPRSHLFIEKTVEKLRTNLLVTSILLACSVLFVISAFAIAGTIVLTPLVKYQWYMIVPTIVGGVVCIISLGFLVKNMVEIYQNTRGNSLELNLKEIDYLRVRGYIISD